MRQMRWTAVLAGVALAAGAQSAPAAVVEATPASLVVRAAEGETNVVTVSGTGSEVVFEDSGAPLSVSGADAAACTQAAPNRVVCARSPFIQLNLNDGDDVVTVTLPTRVWVRAGPGADRVAGGPAGGRLDGGSGDDRLEGGAGEDTLRGLDGDDVLRGGPGNDELEGLAGADDLGGGPGTDIAVYNFRHGRESQRVTVTLDGSANDGARGERDHLRGDMEGAHADRARSGSTLVGNARRNKLHLDRPGTVLGGAGADTLSGNGRVRGGPGDDQILGGGTVLGEAGNDVIYSSAAGVFDGGTGNDYLEKAIRYADRDRGAWPARFVGGPGNDRITAVDRLCSDPRAECPSPIRPFRDSVSCGPGADRAEVDALDRLLGGCERRVVRR
jgi:Ca2+-binding RTX toxin-like protein